jgi:4-carboxymuconolactone decarboxylase
MTRLSYVDPANLSPEQKALYDSIASGPRAAKRASLVDAKAISRDRSTPSCICRRSARIGPPSAKACGSAPAWTVVCSSSTILVIAVHWNRATSGPLMPGFAREAGVEEPTIDALRAGHEPVLSKPDEAAVYRFVHELVTERRVADGTYVTLASLIGESQLVELVNAVGYYVALAAMLNAFAVHPPKGPDDPWPD